MANFARGFNRGFDLRPAADTISWFILNKAERERKRGEDEIQNQILQALLRGTVGEYPPQLRQQEFGTFDDSLNDLEIPLDTTQRRITRDRPFTREEKAGLVGQLSERSFRRFSRMDEILSPKEEPVKYKTIGGNTYLINPDGSIDFDKPVYEKPGQAKYKTIGKKTYLLDSAGKIDFTKPVYIQPTKPSKPEEGYITTKLEVRTQTLRDYRGYPNPKADIKADNTIVVSGVKYTITNIQSAGKVTKKNDDDYLVLSKDTKKLFNNYWSEQQRLLAMLGAVKLGHKIYSKTGIEFEGDVEDLEQGLASYNVQYVNQVKSLLPKSASDWYRDIYNASGNKNPAPIDYWLNLLTAFQNGELGSTDKKEKDDTVDLQILTELFRATYGIEPTTAYGTNINQIQKIIDDAR